METARTTTADGLGHRRIFEECVAKRKNGKKPRALDGLKTPTRRLKKGKCERKPGQGGKRTVRTEGKVRSVREFVERNPSSKVSPVTKICKKSKLPRGTASRILRADVNTKSIRKVKSTRLSVKHRESRAAFAKAYIAAVDSGKLDADAVFFSDEKLFAGGVASSNPHDDRIRVSINAKKSKMRADDIVTETDGKWGATRIMCSMAMAKIGLTLPYFVPKGTKINGENYLEHLESNILPSIAAIARKNGKEKTFSFQQDGASSHKIEPVLRAIEKNAGRPFGLEWPARSPDLTPCDFSLWGEMQQEIDSMEKAPTSEQEVRTAVMLAAESIDKDMLCRAVDHVYTRCQKCIEHNGARFEFSLK